MKLEIDRKGRTELDILRAENKILKEALKAALHLSEVTTALVQHLLDIKENS